MSKIHVMDELLANKIAAGEVVERCSSVVKELVENSIDADSKSISVELEDAGTKMIRVIDDGKGMDKEDAVIAFQRHATSKLLSEDDLFRINTLGFRGEALPSIASVSNIVLKTSTGDVGTVVHISGGKLINQTNGDARRGTIMSVNDLFYNTPARLKHIKSLYAELASVTDYMNKIALSHPDIKFSLTNNEQTILKTDGRGDLLKTIKDIYGFEVAKKMYEIKGENDDYIINGYISYPEVTRANRNYIVIVVNGRVVRNTELNRVINDAYHSYKPDNRYPIAVLDVKVDPSLIDVNIHPTKMDIKFSKMESLTELFTSLIKEKLDHKTIIPKVEKHLNEEESTLKDEINEKINKKESYEEIALNFNVVNDDTPYIAVNEDLIVSDKCSCKEDLVIEEPIKEENRFPKMYPVGLIHGTFIVCQSEDGMYLVDEHAAAERINLERIQKARKEKTTSKTDLIIPITMELTNTDFIILKENKEVLDILGIDVEEFGLNSIIIKSHPVWINKNEEVIIKRIIESVIKEEKNFDIEKFLNSVYAMCACKMSIRANTNITIKEMEQLLEDLSKCDNPFNCAHGRPTMIFYSNYELLKSFKRTGFEIKN